MTLHDDSTVRNLESTTQTMTTAHDTHNGGSAVVDAPEPVQPSSAEPQVSAPDAADVSAPEIPVSFAPEIPVPAAAIETQTAPAPETAAPAASDDFAAALENFTTETEESVGDDHEIDVMREKGETEDGYPKLSHQKAQRLRAWDDIERAHNEKKPIKGVVVERIKGGLTVDINGARAFLPGSQVDLRPIRNLDGMKGQTIEV